MKWEQLLKLLINIKKGMGSPVDLPSGLCTPLNLLHPNQQLLGHLLNAASSCSHHQRKFHTSLVLLSGSSGKKITYQYVSYKLNCWGMRQIMNAQKLPITFSCLDMLLYDSFFPVLHLSIPYISIYRIQWF